MFPARIGSSLGFVVHSPWCRGMSFLRVYWKMTELVSWQRWCFRDDLGLEDFSLPFSQYLRFGFV